MDTGAVVTIQPSSLFETAINFTFISCHLSSSIIMIIIIMSSLFKNKWLPRLTYWQ